MPLLALQPLTGTSPTRNCEASCRQLCQHSEKQHVPRDSHPIWEFAVSSQLNHLIIHLVFKGWQELIHYKGLFCLQIATLRAPRAQIALITGNWSLFQLCLQAGGISLDSQAAVQHSTSVLGFTQPSPRGLLLRATVSDPLSGCREEMVLKHPRGLQAHVELQGAHAASTLSQAAHIQAQHEKQNLRRSPLASTLLTARRRSQRVCAGRRFLGKQLVNRFAGKPQQPLTKKRRKKEGG